MYSSNHPKIFTLSVNTWLINNVSGGVLRWPQRSRGPFRCNWPTVCTAVQPCRLCVWVWYREGNTLVSHAQTFSIQPHLQHWLCLCLPSGGCTDGAWSEEENLPGSSKLATHVSLGMSVLTFRLPWKRSSLEEVASTRMALVPNRRSHSVCWIKKWHTDRQTDRQTNRQTDAHTHTHTHTHTHRGWFITCHTGLPSLMKWRSPWWKRRQRPTALPHWRRGWWWWRRAILTSPPSAISSQVGSGCWRGVTQCS